MPGVQGDAFGDDGDTITPLPKSTRLPPPPPRPPGPPTTGGGGEEFGEGEIVKILEGPFFDFTGTVAAVDRRERTVTVLVTIFERPVPVVLGFGDVVRV